MGHNALYGVLIADTQLRYVDLTTSDRPLYTVNEVDHTVGVGDSVCFNGDVHFDIEFYDKMGRSRGRHICSLFGNTKGPSRNGPVNSFMEFNGGLFDCCEGGLFDSTLNPNDVNGTLVSRTDALNSGYWGFVNSVVDPDPRRGFYVFARDGHQIGPRDLVLVGIEDVTGNYIVGERAKTFHSMRSSTSVKKSVILPWQGFEGEDNDRYDFSILTTFFQGVLYLNSEMIHNSDAGNGIVMFRNVELVNHDRDALDIICSGSGREVHRMLINLDERRVVDREALCVGMTKHINSITPVVDDRTHAMLVRLGRKIGNGSTDYRP